MEIERFDTRECEQAYLCLCCQGSFIEIFSDTPRGIAAHHGFRAVGIEDAHGKVGLRNRRCSDEYESVAANAFMTVAPYDGRYFWIGHVI